MQNLAEQIDQIEDVDKNEEPQPMRTTLDKNKLTPKEVKDLQDEKTTMPKLVRQRNQLEQSAKAEIQGLLNTNNSKDVIDLGDYKDLKQELSDLEREITATDSPEKMKELLDRIRDIPRRQQQKKANQQKQEASEKEELDENDPRLKELKDKFTKICRDNEHLIGGGDVNGYIKWFENELRKKPTIAHGKEVIDQLEGKRVYDNEGLAPRRKIYNELEQAFKKYGIGSPLKSPFIKQEGLQERKDFLQGIKQAETEVKRVNDSFWSPKAKKSSMQEVLMAKNPGEQQDITKKIKKINTIESEGFIYMRNTMNVGGTTVRKMSDASIGAFLLGLKGEGSIKKRLEYVTGNGKYSNGIKEAVENEASLYGKELKPEVAKLFGITNGLEGIYKDNPEGFKLAVKSFEKLDFMKKIQALKEHKKIVEKSENKEELEKKLKVMQAHTEIDESARKKDIAACTQKTYKDWFSDKDNYKNPKNNKPGDLKTLKKFVDILTSDTINKKSHNLAYYAAGRKGFKYLLKETEKNDPKFDKATQKKWQSDYDSKGWTDKTKVYDKLKIIHKKSENEKTKAKFLEAANDNNDTKETKEKLTLEQTIASALQLLADDQPEEAKKKLNSYVENLPDGDPVPREIWNLMKLANKESKEKGEGEKLADTEEKRIEEDVKTIARSDGKIKDRIEEQNLTTLNLEGTKQSENRHEKTVSGQDRAKKESMSRAQGDKLEKDLTEDFYKQTDDKHTLNKEGTGEKMSEIKFDGVDMTDEKRQKLKDDTRKHETQIFDKTGFTHIDMKDKTGKKISAEQAGKKQEVQLEQLEDDLANEALKKEEKRSGKNDKSAFNLNARMAANRKAKDLLNK
ncbi:MAG: hypothetical protein ABID64_03260 [Nitrospirota bacterium]